VAAASFVLLVLVLPQIATGIGLGNLASRLTDSGACGSSGSSGSGSFVSGFGSGSGSGSGSSTCGPTILTALPNSGLIDGQTVSVTGTGFGPNSQVYVDECKLGAGLAGCDESDELEVGTNGSGSFSTSYTVSRLLQLSAKNEYDEKNFNCAPSHCFLGAANLTYQTAAATPLEFKPGSPLALRGTAASIDTVVPKTGVATISGTVTCTQPLVVNIYVNLQQTYRRFNFTSQGEATISCAGPRHVPWTVIVQPGNGLYAAGAANVQAEISAQIGNSYRDIEITRNVVLQTAKITK
jgi:hypothetical protein